MMPERLRIKEAVKNPRSTLAILLMAGVAIAGCGNTKSTDQIPLGTCGSHDYSKAEEPVYNKAGVLATAKKDAFDLQRLALIVGGKIKLHRYSGVDDRFEEISASKSNLRLNFARGPGNNTVDHIDIPIVGNDVFMGEGAVMCHDSTGQLVTNGTFTSLEDYVHQTAGDYARQTAGATPGK